MNARIKPLFLLAALLCAPAGAPPAAVRGAAPATPAQAEAKLAAVRARIAELTRRLGEQLAARDGLAADLRAADLAVTDSRRHLEALRSAALAARRHGAELRAEQDRTQRSLAAERAALAGEVRAAYLNGSVEPLRLLLNQGDPAAVGRMLAYYGYLARARAARIAEIEDAVTRLQGLVAEIAESEAKLRGLEGDALRQAADLEHARSQRAAALRALDLRVSTGHQELERLKREEQTVEALIADLARVVQDFPVDSQQPFDRMRGRLPWPVAGRIGARFQEPRADPAAHLRWNGVLIEAAHGAKVRAPYFGRVVYADWLQGLGLLLIIAHGSDYMTLYGRAEVLYKSVGDWVAPGDVIAALGDGSGESAPRLYFEIRAGRKPVDPKAWMGPGP